MDLVRLPAVTVPARPFLKWVGGKSQLLPVLATHLPEAIEEYTEPFVGGGAVFFHLRTTGRLRGSITLADANEELINAYQTVRDRVEELLEALSEHKEAHSREHYYHVRQQPYLPGVQGAARMIYLNKTCFNGLYRVNASGRFNVPMGAYKSPPILDAPNLRRASIALQGIELKHQDFRKTICDAACGIIYADPPYVPLSSTSSFTGYGPGGFGLAEQEALAGALREASDRGVRFVLSNSYTQVVNELYRDFDVRRVAARRAVNCDGARRGEIDEALVLGL